MGSGRRPAFVFLFSASLLRDHVRSPPSPHSFPSMRAGESEKRPINHAFLQRGVPRCWRACDEWEGTRGVWACPRVRAWRVTGAVRFPVTVGQSIESLHL
ncbi:hypothetical protein DPEC_G00137460 [Dallia pectoralis]|uniref:Uncharacterized protein n=1 Tax=Dallia pectoralis TaxID=75939 RepID=A0ACC2GLZ3_DALPE|nr:hypothetical protein DPEC_G00137460 [Dallia pectoralis]